MQDLSLWWMPPVPCKGRVPSPASDELGDVTPLSISDDEDTTEEVQFVWLSQLVNCLGGHGGFAAIVKVRTLPQGLNYRPWDYTHIGCCGAESLNY